MSSSLSSRSSCTGAVSASSARRMWLSSTSMGASRDAPVSLAEFDVNLVCVVSRKCLCL